MMLSPAWLAKKNKFIEAKRRIWSLEKLDNAWDKIPSLNYLSPFNFFWFSTAIAWSSQVCLIIAANISTNFFSFSKFSLDQIRQAAVFFFNYTIFIAKASNLISFMQFGSSSRLLRSILDLALYKQPSSDFALIAMTNAFIDLKL